MHVRSNVDVILIECVVKGYHECGFTVTAGETFFLEKKIGSRGEAFRVVSCKGQLGHIQKELVEPLWPLDDRKERKLIVVMHVLFIFDLFSIFLDVYTLGYRCNLFLSLMCKLAVFVEALLYAILKAHAIFISVTVLLATLSVT